MGSTEQHYSLRWNDYTVKIVTAFQSLRDEEDFVDVTVACDGHHYSAHKMVLSACSPYFRSLLRANPCQHPIVILKDVGHLEMERLLEFMYNGEVNIAQDQLAAFLKTAENLKIRGLAGSSEEMEQNQNKDIINNSNTINNTSGPTSGKTSPSAGFGSNMVAKEEDVSLDTSSVTYQNKLESPPSKRRKRIIAPATSQADNNTTSHSTDGILTESAVDMDGTGVGGGGLSMEDDLRMIDRREMKPEPTDALCEVYSDTTDLDGQHQGDQVDQRPVMYPIGIAGPSGTGSVGSQENLSSQEPGGLPDTDDADSALSLGGGISSPVAAAAMVSNFSNFGWVPSTSQTSSGNGAADNQCMFCFKSFSNRGSMTRHLRDQHLQPGATVTCDICGKVCKNRNCLITHRSVAHSGRRKSRVFPSGFSQQDDTSPPRSLAGSSDSCSKLPQLLAAAAIQGLGAETNQLLPKAELW